MTEEDREQERPEALLDRFRDNVAKFPDKLAVAFLQPPTAAVEQQRTYRQLDDDTTQLATALLQQSGLAPGDRYVFVVHSLVLLLCYIKLVMSVRLS
jgi:acyl-CoA synthetase (AMP-forming)/AMP-acid ligase II